MDSRDPHLFIVLDTEHFRQAFSSAFTLHRLCAFGISYPCSVSEEFAQTVQDPAWRAHDRSPTWEDGTGK
eukprot:6175057-Pleurochrysis_carterae.AAC.1